MTVDDLLFDPTLPDPAVLSIDGHDLLAEGWAARCVPTSPVPTHLRGCLFADYGVPAEACACTSGTDWLRQRHGQHLRHP